MDNQHSCIRRLAVSIAIIVLLALCLAVTTFALAFSIVVVDNNLFETGVVKVNLNDGKPVIREDEFLFEPGMTVEKAFFLENQSSCDVYYKLYFSNVEGGLAEVLEIEILLGDTLLFSGTPRQMSRAVDAADDVLKLGERREFSIRFHFPETAGNAAQGQFLRFDFAVDAVQTKNNPDKEFE